MPVRIFPDEMEWEDTPRGYYLSEVKEKVLFQDPETGTKIALVKAPVGIMDRLHRHPEARVGRGRRRAFFLGYKTHCSGDWNSEMPTAYLVAPANENEKKHGPTLMERTRQILRKAGGRLRSMIGDNQYSSKRMRRLAKEAVIPLMQLLEQDEYEVRKSAATALYFITGADPSVPLEDVPENRNRSSRSDLNIVVDYNLMIKDDSKGASIVLLHIDNWSDDYVFWSPL